MGRPPAYLFVVRHGNRLDAADKQWHLSSPTPYDPPLTYSGWQQAKSLGVRIANIIYEKIKEEELASSMTSDLSAKPKRKRYQVVIHSSPFLRCIQTSIAISAGLAQDSTPFHVGIDQPQVSPHQAQASSSDEQPKLTLDTSISATATPLPRIRRSVLRLDAWLGEWLSPSYFEFITPPPASVMMLASAKADLLRREDYSHYPHTSVHARSNSSQLWSPSQPKPLENMYGLAGSLPSSTAGSGAENGQSDSTQHPAQPGYIAPVPHYAVDGNSTIPPGFVSHAKDACVDIDYQWDSTRSPLDWGDGGSFPEEWPEMHKRFRAGIQRLVEWYSTTENPTEMVTRSVLKNTKSVPADALPEGIQDVETEAIVILVSHGAGCNALIGAITHKPVLIDVGLTSLTMAVRKQHLGSQSSSDDNGVDGPKSSSPVHEMYDLEIVASTDHIRSPSQSPSASRNPPNNAALSGARGRHLSFSCGENEVTWFDSSGSRIFSANAGLSAFRRNQNNSSVSFAFNNPGIIPRTNTLFSSIKPSSNVSKSSGTGLWTPSSSLKESEREDSSQSKSDQVKKEYSSSSLITEDRTAKIAEISADSKTANGPKEVKFEEEAVADSDGLWGASIPPDEADKLRDTSSHKRRWTVTERG